MKRFKIFLDNLTIETLNVFLLVTYALSYVGTVIYTMPRVNDPIFLILLYSTITSLPAALVPALVLGFIYYIIEEEVFENIKNAWKEAKDEKTN